jgi:hypothetical protein
MVIIHAVEKRDPEAERNPFVKNISQEACCLKCGL